MAKDAVRAVKIAERMLTEDLGRGVWTPCSMVALGALRGVLGKAVRPTEDDSDDDTNMVFGGMDGYGSLP